MNEVTPVNFGSEMNDNQNLPEKETLEMARKSLQDNPVAFIQTIISQMAQGHLDTMREQIELQSAIQFARRYTPDFLRFEPFILQEVAQLISQDEDGVLDPWPDLLERGKEKFKERLKILAAQDPAQAKALLSQVNNEPSTTSNEAAAKLLYQEKAGNRLPTPLDSQFSRKAIEKMSLSEFLNQEEAINKAVRNKKIQ
jgi:hypothetical protein